MSSGSSFGFTDTEVVYELLSRFHSAILEILAYGVYTTVYFVALYLTLSCRNRPRVGSAVVITVMWILVTIHASISWAYLDNIYIQHGETREAQLGALFSIQTGELFPLAVTNSVMALISVLLADVTMIWRCWVLYGKRRFIVIIPGLSLVAVFVCYVWRTVIIFRPVILRPNQVANLDLSYLSATVITNIFCTTAIICRITSVSGWKKSLKTYRGLMEILIESSILYTTIYMIRIGLQVHSQYFTEELDERVQFAQAMGYSITGLAPTLIIARVAAGYARPDDSWTRTSLPHIGSTIRSLAESLRFAQPAPGTTVDNVDLERGMGSEGLGRRSLGKCQRRFRPLVLQRPRHFQYVSSFFYLMWTLLQRWAVPMHLDDDDGHVRHIFGFQLIDVSSVHISTERLDLP